uniref:L-aspartate oxidase n=1 Tax=Tessaracoccus timonensis TaxID=2161816 RepID=UPI000D54F917|nr:L-aspartate oxidase [Tessaracoccus timonensis]
MTELALPPATHHHEADVVIVGSGAAALSVALHLAVHGITTAILTRADVMAGSTDWAQGGLAAVWSPDDSVEAHVRDTLVAGAGACDEEAVRTLVAEAPVAIRRLITLGAQFDRAHGNYSLHLEGGHSARRILHSGGDASGHEVQRTLVAALQRILDGDSPATLHPNMRAVDVLTSASGRACGVRAVRDGEVHEWRAGAVVLASGGVGQAWTLTSNPSVATGDGLAMAARVGAALRGVEFVQFHPTVLAAPRVDGRDVLISEAVRGEGGVLVDASGFRFMPAAHPLAELAPRDVVAAAIEERCQATGEPHMLLDARHLGRAGWSRHFPTIQALLHARGIDPATQPIPVRPGAHYLCGGVAADMAGRTSVPGLFAVGEVAGTGVHGANRLASNSITEALVMGQRCGELLADNALPAAVLPEPRPTISLTDPAALPVLRTTMDRHVGVLRDEAGLRTAADTLTALPATSATSDAALDASQLREAALQITLAASARRESRGCHRRTDIQTTSERADHAA